ncbi:MAG: hypothetical protein JW774_03230 [Candidatus Aureabacteria bacterium]|nr:hypothetical protein [Candidatus Auribacterota bacterium]
MKKKMLFFVILSMVFIGGCDIENPFKKDDDDEPEVTTTEPENTEPIDLSTVTWLHTNVSQWAVTATLDVSVSGDTIHMNYDKANTWPGKDVFSNGKKLNCNVWIFVKQDDVWYGATWEWMAVGCTSKPKSKVSGDHIEASPLIKFRPQSGVEYGFMVSGLARNAARNVEERTPVVMYTWP